MQLKTMRPSDIKILREAAEKLDNYNFENPQEETESISQDLWGLIGYLEN